MIKRLLTKIGAVRCAGLFLLAMLLAGCGREEIMVYRVPKEKEPELADTQPRIEWQTPPGWEEQAPSKMSLANFSVPGDAGRQAQLSVMTFPGEGASELAW